MNSRAALAASLVALTPVTAAECIARKVDSVKTVKNEITVRPAA